jgi:hypothetical protein
MNSDRFEQWIGVAAWTGSAYSIGIACAALGLR